MDQTLPFNQTIRPTLEPCLQGGALLLRIVSVTLPKYDSVPPAIVGLPGNLLIILIANRKHNRNLSPSIYMTAMAVVDSLLLLFASVFFFLFYTPGAIQTGRDVSFVTCMTIIITSGMLSGFYLCAMSVDRLIAVRFPMSAPTLCTPGRARKVVIIGTFLIGGANTNMLYTMKYVQEPNTGIEVMSHGVPGDPVGSWLTTSFQLIFGAILPFLLIITCNVIIILTVKRAALKRSALQGKTAEKNVHDKNEAQYLTRMLIFVSMAYVIISAPFRLYPILLLIPEIGNKFNLSLTCDFLRYNLVLSSFYAIWVWNFAVNFYMYCLGGGKRYRKDTVEVFKTLFTPWRR